MKADWLAGSSFAVDIVCIYRVVVGHTLSTCFVLLGTEFFYFGNGFGSNTHVMEPQTTCVTGMPGLILDPESQSHSLTALYGQNRCSMNFFMIVSFIY